MPDDMGVVMGKQTTPTVKSFLIADQVFRQEGNGKWCAIGIFENIASPTFPMMFPGLGLLLKVGDAHGKYAVRLEFRDGSDRCLAFCEGSLELGSRLAEPHIGLQVNQLPIPGPGTYFIKILFDGQQAESDIKIDVPRMEPTP